MLHNVKVFIKETVKKALKPVLLLVIKNPDNLLLRIYSQYLYNSVISGLSKMNLEAGEKLPYSIEKKWNRINKILSYSDPIITVTENKAKIKMRLSHKNIFYYARFPLYDRALPRICREIQKINNELVLIDIGANIGDTAVLVSQSITGGGGGVMCVEGNEKIIPFLKKNTAQIKNLDIYYDFRFCTDATENNQFSVEMKDGTAHLVTSLNSEVKAASLDTMITEQPFFKKTNILKIDTDGFEITVLNGAKRLLKEQQPVIYFEYTPDAYIENGQDPYSLFSILVPYGYSKALFYTNFGDVLGIFDMKDAGKMRELVSRIDNKKICYYDILAIPDIKYNDYSQIFESEIQRKVISRGL